MIDRKAFRTLTSGLYLITSRESDRKVGCVVNTLVQVASAPPTLAVALNKDNVTTAAIDATGRFAAAVLSEAAPMELIGAFGFRSSADTDKFADCPYCLDGAEIPYVTAFGLARFSVRVTEKVDVGTHYLFVGIVEEADVLGAGEPLTYADYHRVKGGKTPPKAATFNGGEDGIDAVPAAAPAGDAAAPTTEEAPKRVAWRCPICGYVEEGYPDGLPADYTCPICGVPGSMFERVEI